MANPLARPITGPTGPRKIGLKRRTMPKLPKQGLTPRPTAAPARPAKASSGKLSLKPLPRKAY